MPAQHLTTGFYGKIPATGDFVAWNLPRKFIDRWDRWMAMELVARPDEGELDTRIWRFTVPAGIFFDEPAAGAWRMSEDRVGRRYPFAVAGVGGAPEPSDPWFDGVAEVLREAVEMQRSPDWLRDLIAALPKASAAGGSPRIAFWLDDWEVNELGFSDIHDLAANGLPAMRAARRETSEH